MLALVLKIILKTVLSIVLIGGVLLCTLWMAFPYLSSTLSSAWCPSGVTLQIGGRPRWAQQRLHLPPLVLHYQYSHSSPSHSQGCQLFSVSGATIYYPISGERRHRWYIALAALSTNTDCWQSFRQQLLTKPFKPPGGNLLSLSAWQAKLPSFWLTINQLHILPKLTAPATVILTQHAGNLRARCVHPMAVVQGTLDWQRRLVIAFELKQALVKHLQQGKLQGEIVLSEKLNSWPERGQLQAQLQSRTVPKTMHAHLRWKGSQGLLLITNTPSSPPLLKLPWHFSKQRLQFTDGHWNWSNGHHSLRGTLQLTISNWQHSSSECAGKKQLPKDGNSAKESGLTAMVKGRVQLHHTPWGKATLQMNGQVDHLSLTSANWQWNYHCQGVMTSPQAHWQSNGQGAWQNQQLIINQLSATVNRLQQRSFIGEKLRLTWQTPWRWSYRHHPFTTALRLTAQQLRFPNGQILHHPTLDLRLKALEDPRYSKGSDGDYSPRLSWWAVAKAGGIGPLKGQGSWAGQKLQGVVDWQQRSLVALQPLLAPQWDWRLQAGNFSSSTRFYITATQPLTLTGRLQIKAGAVALKKGQISGITLDLPYRWRQQRWHLGSGDRSVTLRIQSLHHFLNLSNITLDAKGYFPYRFNQPLQLSNVTFDAFGGQLSLPLLRLPQQQHSSLLKLTNLDLAQLTALLKTSHLTLNGCVSGEFPVYTDHPRWLIHHGLLHNTTPLTSKMDKKLADTLRRQPKIPTGAVDWLELLHIGGARAQIHLDTLGNLRLKTEIKGVNPQQGQPVHLHYQHQEDLLALWRSLQASERLQQQIEQQAPAPWRKRV